MVGNALSIAGQSQVQAQWSNQQHLTTITLTKQALCWTYLPLKASMTSLAPLPCCFIRTHQDSLMISHLGAHMQGPDTLDR